MLRTRVLTGVALAIVVLFSVFGLDNRMASLVFGLFWLVGTDEWARLARFSWFGRIACVAGFVLIVAVELVSGLPAAAVTAWLWAAALIWIVTFVLVLRYPVRVPNLVVAAAGLIVLPAAWLSFHNLHAVAGNGPGLVLSGLFIVWSADIGAYFTGRSIGRTALSPRVSPKKTWEGVAGGVTLAMITGLAAAALFDLPYGLMAPVAAVMALISVVGDLGVSMLKRNAGLKDTGVLLPGHGGVMDRFDGVTAALPFFVSGLQFAHVLD